MKRVAIAALVLAAGTTVSAQPQYSVQILPQMQTASGPVPVGGRALNEVGWVIGQYGTQAFGDPYGYRVAVLRPGQEWQDIGHPGSLVTLSPKDVNNAGMIVGSASTSFSGLGTNAQVWTWQDGQFTLYPHLVPGRITSPGFTNEAGRLIGLANDGSFATNKAVEFLPPAVTTLLLPGIPGGNSALDVNNHGVILGGELLGVFLWAPGADRWYLPPPSSLPIVEFNMLNDRNDVVGMARAAGHTETRTAVVWLDGVGWQILPRNARRCNALRINNAREVIGSSQDNAGPIGNHAWYWRPGMPSIQPLEYLITDPPGVYAVGFASDINEHGQILAGITVRSTGQGFQAILNPIITTPLQLDLVSNAPPGPQRPGEPLRVDLRILDGTEMYMPGTAQVHYRPSPASGFVTIPMEILGPTTYTALLPAASCGDSPEFYFTAGASGGGTVRLPADAPTTLLAPPVGAWTTNYPIDERFESGVLPAGWSATGLWTVNSTCFPGGEGFCYDGGVGSAYYGIPGPCNYDTGGVNSGILTSPAVTLPNIAPGGEIRLTYCSSRGLDSVENSATCEVLINGVVRDSFPSWNPSWERRVLDLSAYAGQSVVIEWRFSTGIFGTYARGWNVDNVRLSVTDLTCAAPACYANCDQSTAAPVLNVADFGCFLGKFAAGDAYANCDGSTTPPVLNVADFSCYLQSFAAGCR